MPEFEWTCHVCGKMRPDEAISVRQRPLGIDGVDACQNIRYCNDDPECVEESKTTFLISGPTQKGDAP